MTIKYTTTVCCLTVYLLSGCQTTLQKSVNQSAEINTKDSDLVMMPALAGGSKAKSSYQLKTMSLEELSNCAQNLFEIKKSNASLNVQNTELEKRKIALAETEKYLIERRLKIDTHNAKLVKEFNQEGNKYMESIKQLQFDISGYNNQVNKSNLNSNTYNTNCINRTYKVSDLQQLAPNLIEVMQNNSEIFDVPLFDNSSTNSDNIKTKSGSNNSTIHIPGSYQK